MINLTVFLHFVIFPVLYKANQSGGKNMTIGENSLRESFPGCCYGTHAEMDAIKHLPPLKNKAKKIDLNLVVIRTDISTNLKNSKPCFKCIQYIYNLNKISIYRIKNIYYSNQQGNITMIKFYDLYMEENKHISIRFRKKKK